MHNDRSDSTQLISPCSGLCKVTPVILHGVVSPERGGVTDSRRILPTRRGGHPQPRIFLAITLVLAARVNGRAPGHALQGYLAHKKQSPPYDPAVGLCLGTYGDPRRVGVSYERGTPVKGAGAYSRRSLVHWSTPFPVSPASHYLREELRVEG